MGSQYRQFCIAPVFLLRHIPCAPLSCHSEEEKYGLACPIMTPEEQARLRQLPRLIAEENDPEKMKILAGELERLLILEGRIKRIKDEKSLGN